MVAELRTEAWFVFPETTLFLLQHTGRSCGPSSHCLRSPVRQTLNKPWCLITWSPTAWPPKHSLQKWKENVVKGAMLGRTQVFSLKVRSLVR